MPKTSCYGIKPGKEDPAALIEEIKNYFEFLARTGCRGFECSAQSLETLKNWGTNRGFEVETMEKIRTDLGDCRRCKLSETRKNIVFGEGNFHARLVFVGEAPGAEEDHKGIPFVGAAGRLLTRIMHAINLTREQVYICNILKCRPPENRNPMPDEIEACLPFLKRQLMVIRPEFICALGTIAAQTLLETKEPIWKLRGRFHDYMGIKIIPTYHPAYLLYNPDKKRDVWEDMKKLMKALNG
jgi:uracil-DNA glycosylase family 4